MTRIEVPGVSSPGTRFGWRRPRRQSATWPYLAPAIATLLAIGLYPLIQTFNLSFRSFSYILPGRKGQWVGLDNYQALLQDPSFLGAVGRTIVFTSAAVFLELLVGLLLAAALNITTSGRRLLVSLLIIPMILTPVIIGLMFNFALNPLFGPLAQLVDALGIARAEDILGTPFGAFASLVLVDVWQWTPFMALILWAGMQALPTPPLEAAAVDGASFFQRLRLVMLPMLRPVVVVAVIFRASEAVREFDKVFVLTGGGPGSATEVLDLFTYRTAFVNWDMSLGAAMGVVVFLAALTSAILFYAVVTRGGREA
jgi:multiple sugar transport system permease protein